MVPIILLCDVWNMLRYAFETRIQKIEMLISQPFVDIVLKQALFIISQSTDNAKYVKNKKVIQTFRSEAVHTAKIK